jgi:hypothetical protein
VDDFHDERVPSGVRLRSTVTTVPSRSEPGQSARSVHHRRARFQRRWPAVVAVVAVVVVISLLLPGGRHQWAVSLFRQPSRYTVLAFSDPANLPHRARRGEPLTVAFSISNYEGRPVTYRYVLSEDSGGAHRVLGASARSVGTGRTATVVTTVRPSCRTSPCRMEVSLPGHQETIDFLVSLVTRQPAPARRGQHPGSGHQTPAGGGGG